MNNEQNKEEAINLKDLIKPYVKRWYWFLFSFLVAVVNKRSYI